jgi:hypothetical protein
MAIGWTNELANGNLPRDGILAIRDTLHDMRTGLHAMQVRKVLRSIVQPAESWVGSSQGEWLPSRKEWNLHASGKFAYHCTQTLQRHGRLCCRPPHHLQGRLKELLPLGRAAHRAAKQALMEAAQLLNRFETEVRARDGAASFWSGLCLLQAQALPPSHSPKSSHMP